MDLFEDFLEAVDGLEGLDARCTFRNNLLTDLFITEAHRQILDPLGFLTNQRHQLMLYIECLQISHGLEPSLSKLLAKLAAQPSDISNWHVSKCNLEVPFGNDSLAIGFVLRACNLCNCLVHGDSS